jgi:hypothetical protein
MAILAMEIARKPHGLEARAFSLAYPEAHMIALAGFGEKKRDFVWAVVWFLK